MDAVPSYRQLSASRRVSDHYFYSGAAAANLLWVFIGFQQFFLHGEGDSGRVIATRMFALDAVHGTIVVAWFVLLLVQSLLVSSGNRRLHRKLGWLSVALVPLVAISSVMVALRSVQLAQHLVVFQMPNPNFLMVMLGHIAGFFGCAVAGIVLRKRPAAHRVLMLVATVCLLPGATARISWLNDCFGGYDPTGYFGPVFAWGALLVIVGSFLRGALDRRMVAGWCFIVSSNLVAFAISSTDGWRHWSAILLG